MVIKTGLRFVPGRGLVGDDGKPVAPDVTLSVTAPVTRVTKPVTKLASVTKPIAAPGRSDVWQSSLEGQGGSIPPSGTKSKGGRPKVHASAADKQAAYRARKKGGQG